MQTNIVRRLKLKALQERTRLPQKRFNSRCHVNAHLTSSDKMKCKHCKDLCTTYDFGGYQDLTKAIRNAKKYISDGIIRLIQTQNFTGCPWNEVNEEGPWHDIVEYNFECTYCRQRFKLFADTYHGHGKWMSK